MADEGFESGLTIGNTFSVNDNRLVIKQEPLDPMDEDPVYEDGVHTNNDDNYDNHGNAVDSAAIAGVGDDAGYYHHDDGGSGGGCGGGDDGNREPGENFEVDDENDNIIGSYANADTEILYANLTLPEDSDVVMQRAVSPPSYILDASEEKIKELILFYKEKYNLKNLQIKLQRCDKIWETLQLIKNFQNSFDIENNSPQYNLSENTMDSPREPSKSPSLSSHQSLIPVNDKKFIPDLRFSVKNKKMLFHCITCQKQFFDRLHLKQHAINQHGIFFNPKRLYKPRTVNKFQANKEITFNADDNKLDKEVESILVKSKSPVGTPHSEKEKLPPKHTENIESTISKELKTNGCVVKTSNAKQKIKCILCKRISADIVYHMKGYHKVGCVSSIVAQCEKIMPDNNNKTEPKIQSTNVQNNCEIVSHIKDSSLNSTVLYPVKKRKRGTTHWTIKKKYKYGTSLMSNGPFKCNVCLGLYKNIKTFTYHKTLHQIRGETRENFDPSTCRFFNSPLRYTTKEDDCLKEIKNEITSNQSETETTLMSEALRTEIYSSANEDVEKMNEDLSVISDDLSGAEQTKCECGRSFRNYHTLYLHKVKCKGTVETKIGEKLCSQNSNNDADSGIGISIKIKKNKNDSYEVVPSNATPEDNYKDFRNSKDSDASSNDSGMVSIDYNNHRADNLDLSSKYGKNHSILRIQVAEDDEEVDIEDGEDLNKAEPKSLREKKVDSFMDSMSRESHTVPSLTNLCKQVLSKKTESEEVSDGRNSLIDNVRKMKKIKSSCPCGKSFKSLKYLNIHIRRYHPQLLSCMYCMTNFDRVEKYVEHECKVTEGKFFIEPIIQTECIQCKALVDLGEQFDKHMKTHNLDSTTFQCFKCDSKFDNQDQRKLHFDLEHGFSLCRICNKLLHIDYLSKHEAYHDGLGYPCHICKKSFSEKTCLKKHIQITHDDSVNEIVKCNVCSKKIKLRHFKKHLSFHLHVEICKKCNKCSNNDQEKLKNHRDIMDDSIDCGNKEYVSNTPLSSKIKLENET